MAVNLSVPISVATIDGVSIATVAAELRYTGRDDLALIELAEGTTSAAVFTQNHFAAAPVVVARDHLKACAPRALLVNMGNANAATGAQGLANCQRSCEIIAELLGIKAQEVLPFSTGVIGEQLPMSKFAEGLAALAANTNQSDWHSAAAAIMTTDTIPKVASRTFELEGEQVSITGISKGSGMICPNMATMLGFVCTDAQISQTVLDEMLSLAVEQSFNRITVDSDTSTNDAVVLSATGHSRAAGIESIESSLAGEFYSQLEAVMIELATAIVRDGEGATKFVQVRVSGGKTQADSEAVAYAVANSPLVKTALFAEDPNWGRLAMAIGKADAEFVDASQVSISVNGVDLMRHGLPAPDYTEQRGQEVFSESEIVIAIDLAQGDCNYHVWTSDLSHEYVSINADYRS